MTKRQLHTNSESNQIKLEKPYASHDILGSRTDIHQYHIKREAKRANHTFHNWHQQRMGCSTHSKYGAEVIRTLSIKPFTRDKLNHVCQPIAHCPLCCRKYKIISNLSNGLLNRLPYWLLLIFYYLLKERALHKLMYDLYWTIGLSLKVIVI
jgi:hypothetical protein